MLTEDSYSGSIDDPLSLNLYTYCNNSPLNYYDPDGHMPKWLQKLKEVVVDNTVEGWNTLTNPQKRQEAFELIDQYGSGWEKNLTVACVTVADTTKGILIDTPVLVAKTAYDDINYVGVQGAHTINKLTGTDDSGWYENANDKAYNAVNSNVNQWANAGKGIITSVKNTFDPSKASNLFNVNAPIADRVEYAESAVNTVLTAMTLKAGIKYAAGKFEVIAPNTSLKISTAFDNFKTSVKTGMSDMLQPRMNAITPDGFKVPMIDEPTNISYAKGNGSSSGKFKPIEENEVTTYEDFDKRSVIGDGLEGHEVWQHANIKAKGLATERLSTDASKNNPVIALKRSLHKIINKAQRSLDAANQEPLDNIKANSDILRESGIPADIVEDITNRAIQHGKNKGVIK